MKFTYEPFRRLRPRIPLMALYGKQDQVKRVAIYNDFCRKTSAVLLATDIAARGLGKGSTFQFRMGNQDEIFLWRSSILFSPPL